MFDAKHIMLSICREMWKQMALLWFSTHLVDRHGEPLDWCQREPRWKISLATFLIEVSEYNNI